MYQIRLASGEETVFQSIDELTIGVRSGIVTADALILHKKTGQWLPIARHPHFQIALANARTPGPAAPRPSAPRPAAPTQ
ncbi:MAG TPA: hypothetical protein VNK43_08170, partial [Gemmatimonadales bacterium]|nr:hypothetical protein [Gemmatimonadales bacterium]